MNLLGFSIVFRADSLDIYHNADILTLTCNQVAFIL